MEKMKALLARGGVAVATVAVAAPTFAADGDLDFSAITGAISAGTIVAAISAIAAIKILPGVAKWGYNKVIGWFR
ncbi:hypothetical protein D9M68_226410 [compost metagenome]